jgi:hypothetical protein
MRRTLALLLLSLTMTPLASAAGWKKSYFGATKPGTWARYADHTSYLMNIDVATTMTMTRLSDEDSQPRIEMKVLDSDGKNPWLVLFTLKRGFAVDRDLIDFGPAIVAAVHGEGETQKPLDAATVAEMVKRMREYGPAAVFKGRETIDGKKVDRYAYTLTHPGGSVETGVLWLSDTVPFGVVRHTYSIKQKSGKISTTSERKLVASGSDADTQATKPTPKSQR